MTAHSDDMSDFVVGPSKQKKNAPRRRFSLIRVLVVLGILMLLVALFLPATRSAGEAVRRSQCVNNLKQIALALNNYETVYKALPPAHTVNASGKPLHSWRTLILPYLEQQRRYDTIDLSKPWTDPANAVAYKTELAVFRCPSADCPANHTTYMAIVAPGGCFLADTPRKLSEITDGTSETLMVIEVSSEHHAHWMAPADADETLVMGFGPGTKFAHPGGANGAFVDGSVRFLKADMPAAGRRALISIAGNDKWDAEAR